jgi:hypothetical protein
MRVIAFLMLPGIAMFGQTSPPPASNEPPKRTLFDSKGQTTSKPAAPPPQAVKPSGGAAPESGRGASYRALDALGASTEDMNAIRDSNVRRLTKDGCAPEVSARIADLRSKLQAAGVDTGPAERSARAGREESGPDTSTLAVASNWFKATGENKAPAAKDKSNDLLDSVLPAAGKGVSEAKPREQEDVASLKTELEHLYAACPAAKR